MLLGKNLCYSCVGASFTPQQDLLIAVINDRTAVINNIDAVLAGSLLSLDRQR